MIKSIMLPKTTTFFIKDHTVELMYNKLNMKYDLLVIAFKNKRAKTIVAHQLANDPSIPLHEALAMMDDLPVTLIRNMELDELMIRMEKLKAYRRLLRNKRNG